MSFPADVLAVMDRDIAERSSSLDALICEIAAGRVSDFKRELTDILNAHRQAVAARAAVADLLKAAAGVNWFDWSDSDSDAVHSIKRLASALRACGAQP